MTGQKNVRPIEANNMNQYIKKTIIPYLLFLFVICISCSEKSTSTFHIDQSETSEKQNPKVLELMNEFKVKGAGIGYIENGQLTRTEYYGDQAPNQAVTASTMFNVASVTKAITAELFLRLAAKGEVDLDESISAYYVYADLASDPRHKLLTPRIILTHRTGFKNWPYEYEDGLLAFENDPGNTFGYSGIGFYILAKFMEEKMSATFPHLVEEHIFIPLEMKNSSIVIEPWFQNQRPIPVDINGKYMKPYDFNYGYWNSADELHTSVEDYAKFLISSMNGDGLTKELILEREKIFSDLTNDPIFGTNESTQNVFYPPSYGYGLGWMVFDYGDGNKNIQHGGNDGGENAMGYFHTKSKNGLIVFLNGGNGAFMIPRLVELLDKEQKYSAVYNYILDKFYSE